MSVPVLRLHGVCKRYPHFNLRDIDLELDAGRALALAGPNGSGKSTLLRIVMGLVRPDGGIVQVLGHAMTSGDASAKAHVALVSDDLRLHGSASLRWHADFVRSLVPVWDERRADALAGRFGLSWGEAAGGFSRGQTAKAQLLLALARRPRLLLLDEATAPLDASSRADVLAETLGLVREEGMSMLITSHREEDLAGRVDATLELPAGILVPARPKARQAEAAGVSR